MDNEPLFAASRMKLNRAGLFIEELKAELQAYADSKPISGQFDFAANPPSIRIEWKGIGLKPGAITGDAIHNMRTALDLMASELARLNEKSDKDVYFPFASSAETLPEAIKKRRFDKTGEDAVALLEQFEPYHGGKGSLRAIHDLDIQDKHTGLIPYGSTRHIEVEGTYHIDNPDGEPHTLSIKDTEIYYSFPADSPVFAGLRIIETLEELMQLVNRILEAFARMVEARPPAT